MKVSTLIIVGLYLLAWFFQSELLLNSDDSWLIEASRRMLAGGKYITSFFEINPPMILYVYAPCVWLTKLFALPTAIALRIYIFTLATLSLWLCSRLLNKIILPTDDVLQAVLMMVISVIFLILPINEFGQREHFLVILSLPYFFLVAARLQNQEWSCSKLSWLIGIFAGVGFAIKPYFFSAFILTELYYFYRKRQFIAFFRPEAICVGLVLAAYLLVLFIWHQDYLQIVLPQITHYYYQQVHSRLSVVYFSNQAFYAYFVVLFYYIRYDHHKYSELATVLMIAALGFYISYCIQCTHWFYHIIPTLSLNLILLALLFTTLITSKTLTRHDYLSVGLFAALLLSYIIYRINYIWLGIDFYPNIYFSLFVSIFSLVLCIADGKKHLWRTIMALCVIFFSSYIFYLYLNITTLRAHQFFLTTAMLSLFYVLLIPNKMPSVKAKYAFFAMIGILIFAFPFYQSAYIYAAAIAYKSQYMGLVKELKLFPTQSVYFITDSDSFPYPALDINHQKLASRFSAFAGFPNIKNMDDTSEYVRAYMKDKNNIDFIINAVIQDFIHYQPDLIFVDVRRADKTKKLGYFGNNQIDYLKLFDLHPGFQSVWKNYHYIKTVDGQPLYKFKIYERNTT